MKFSAPKHLIDLSEKAQKALVEGARDAQRVTGLTHNFYRYPARFSPAFVKSVIETFTKPGDTILDPYMGGATSLVEALALGRHAVGIDINQLAEFIAQVKTTTLDEHELKLITAWASRLQKKINLSRPAARSKKYAEAGYYRHLNHSSRWRLRKAIEQAISSAATLRNDKLEAFARCAVLRTAQWALDGRKKLPSFSEFRQKLIQNSYDMIASARDLKNAAKQHKDRPKVKIINRSVVGLEKEQFISKMPAPKLIVTSPPYPGVHVLYHRWQVDGRKETAAPYWIAKKLDGSGASYYTLGDRKCPELRTYFENLYVSMLSLSAICNDETIIVQMVAFQDASWQLPRYLEVMEEAGFVEVMLPILQEECDGRLWRSVPNRKWYSEQRGDTPGSQEVVLIHKKQITLRQITAKYAAVNEPLPSA